ncbi:hypothetical protein V8C86DRAFT_1029753 [Haematococcus lacustris]
MCHRCGFSGVMCCHVTLLLLLVGHSSGSPLAHYSLDLGSRALGGAGAGLLVPGGCRSLVCKPLAHSFPPDMILIGCDLAGSM